MVLYGCVIYEHVLFWYCPDIAVPCIKKPTFLSSFSQNISLCSPRLKQRSEKGMKYISLLCMTLITFPDPFRQIIFGFTIQCALCKGEVFLGDPSKTWRQKGAFCWDLYDELWPTGLNEGLKTEVPVTECTLTEGQWPSSHQFAHSPATALWERLVCFLLGGGHCYLPCTSFIDTTLSIISVPVLWKKIMDDTISRSHTGENAVICRAGVIKAGKEGETAEEKHLVPSSLS